MTKGEVYPLLLLYLLKTLLVYLAQVHKKQVALTVYLYIQLFILTLSCLSNKKPKVQNFFAPYLFSLLINLPNLHRDQLIINHFHISLQQGVQILNPCLMGTSREFGRLQQLFRWEHHARLIVHILFNCLFC